MVPGLVAEINPVCGGAGSGAGADAGSGAGAGAASLPCGDPLPDGPALPDGDATMGADAVLSADAVVTVWWPVFIGAGGLSSGSWTASGCSTPFVVVVVGAKETVLVGSSVGSVGAVTSVGSTRGCSAPEGGICADAFDLIAPSSAFRLVHSSIVV